MQVYYKMWSHSDNLGLTNYIAEVSGTSKYRFLGFLLVKLKIKLKLRKSFCVGGAGRGLKKVSECKLTMRCGPTTIFSVIQIT